MDHWQITIMSHQYYYQSAMPGVLLRGAAISIFAITGLTLALWAQNSGLVVQVNPEAHLNPSTAQLSFAVTNPGETVVSAPVTITAWVRSLPNQQIQLTAQPVNLTGLNAAAPPVRFGPVQRRALHRIHRQRGRARRASRHGHGYPERYRDAGHARRHPYQRQLAR
jgi:hypothetical protein